MSEQPQQQPKRGLRGRVREGGRTFQVGLWLRLLLLGLAAAFLLLFVVLNTHHTKVSFVFGSTKVSVIWVILLSFGIGIATGILLSQVYRRRTRR